MLRAQVSERDRRDHAARVISFKTEHSRREPAVVGLSVAGDERGDPASPLGEVEQP